MFFRFSLPPLFFFPRGIFIRWEDFLANKIFVHMLSSLETLEFGINKLFFPVLKKIMPQKQRLAAIETFLTANLPAALLLNQFGAEHSL